MKICLLSKYPPIEGGVSVRNYWMARGLASRGHQVYVVTNAFEVEDAFRMRMLSGDEDWLEPRFPESGGFVRLVPMPATTLQYRYIPWSNPFVTRLASLACQTIRQYGCEAIYSYYFEPYGVAAHLASRWTGVPYTVKHAGSDLGRLINQSDLKTTYEEIMKAAGLVVTDAGHKEIFTGLGVRPDHIFTDLSFALSADMFHPGAEPMDVAAVLAESDSQLDPPTQSVPTIGIYGKTGDMKGSYDLLRALGQLRSQGQSFQLLAMTHGWQKREDLFRSMIDEQGLTPNTWILPFLPPWRVPGFIRRCDAVCFLERNFPIAGHAPVVPQEVLACGTCLVVSLEIARRPMYSGRLIHGINALIVRDPRHPDELAESLRLVISHPDRSRQIGAEGPKAANRSTPETVALDSAEAMFRQLVEGRRANPPKAKTRLTRVLTSLRAQMPWTAPLLGDRMEESVRIFARTKSPETAEAFGAFLQNRIASGALDVPYLPEVLRYELNCIIRANTGNGSDDRDAALYRAGPLTPENGAAIRDAAKPYLCPHVRIESFDYDMECVMGYLDRGLLPPALPKTRSTVVFDPGGSGRTFQVSTASADLLPMLDGGRPIASIHEELATRYGLTSAGEREQLLHRVEHFLGELLKGGIIGVRE